MAYSYIQAIGKGFPTVQCRANGRGEQYNELTWENGDPLPTQATLDAWIAANTEPAPYVYIAPTSSGGSVLSFYTGTTGSITGTAVIPADNTAPLITEGAQIWNQSITPVSDGSRFIIDQAFMLDSGAANKNITVAIFRNSTCIYATCVNIAQGGRPVNVMIHHIDVPGAAAPFTYSLRCGTNSSSTWYINNTSTTITYGGVANSGHWSIMEI